ncbi:MAG: glycosyltransferase [Candidatus Cloacimonetes bacterium]|nr:glycosyltransferase [Candidatus Cloacimonadota bacterium]
MKIAFLGPAYPFRGGIAQFLHNMADHLAKNNEIEVFNFKNQYPKFFFPGKNQFDLTEKKQFKYKIHRVLTPYNPFTWKQTAEKIINYNPDIIIIKFWIPFFSLAYLYIMKYLRLNSEIRICLLCHNLEFHEKWFMLTKLTKYLIDNSHKVIVLSQTVAYSTKNFKNFNQDKLIELFHPLYEIDTNTLDKQKALQDLNLKDIPTVLFFGYIKHYKGLDVFLQAIPKVSKKIKDIQFVVAGEIYGKDTQYQKIIKNFTQDINFVFNNKYIPSSDIDKYFISADLVVIPYRTATQSGIVQLAYSYNKPVIVSNINGLKDMIIEGKTGLSFENENSDDLAKIILDFFNKKQNFVSYIKDNNKKYSWQAFTEKLVENIL